MHSRTRRTAAAALGLALCTLGPAALAAAPPDPKKKSAEYEMTTYYVAFLYKGPAWTADLTPEAKKLQEGHMANIERLGASGQLLIAGPFTDKGDLRGLFVFRVGSAEEARALCDSDPAIKAGRLRAEIHPWYAAKNIVVTPTATPPR